MSDEFIRTLATEELCTGCGYDVRGLPVASRCPECGDPVPRFCVDGRLERANVKWLDTIRRGVLIKAATVGAAAIAVIIYTVLDLLPASGRSPVLIHIVVQAFFVWGTLCLTAQEPRVSRIERALSLRTVTRLVIVAGFVGLLFEWAARGILSLPVRTLGLSPFYLLGVSAIFCEALYLRSLSIRAGDSRAGGWLACVLCLSVLQGIYVIAVIVLTMLAGTHPILVQTLWKGLVLVESVLLFLLCVCYVGVFVGMFRIVDRSLQKARSHAPDAAGVRDWDDRGGNNARSTEP